MEPRLKPYPSIPAEFEFNVANSLIVGVVEGATAKHHYIITSKKLKIAANCSIAGAEKFHLLDVRSFCIT